MQVNSRKYKDELPEKTVSYIKEKLLNLGLATQEDSWLNSVDGFFSLSVHIKGTDISTNGKGTTPEYALASAYGELMERLQNQTFFRLNGNLSDEAFHSHGFYYAPDEACMNISDLLSNKSEWLISQLASLDKKINSPELLLNWKSIYMKETGCDFVCLPYMNVMTNKISYIPINTISKMYMSNGMSAGNTREEAIVQGLSELFERVVNCKIIKDRLTPPTIPDHYIQAFPKVYRMVQSIQGIEGCHLIIKDCSLNKGYPVVGIILINEMTQSYFVKFGAHPIFQIALERCLTELLQGQSIWNMKGMHEYKFYETAEDQQNILGILVNGIGKYPNELFDSHESYPFKPYSQYDKKDNKEFMIYMLDILKNEGYEVYVRDVSFLGFPSYHIIVPHFSEVEKIDDIDSVKQYTGYVLIRKYIRHLSKLSPQSIYELIGLLNNYQMNGNVMNLLGIPCNCRMIWYYNDINLFRSMLYYCIGNFRLSYNCFEMYLMSGNKEQYQSYLYTYYKCVRDYIGARAQGMFPADIRGLLLHFYEETMIHEVFYHFQDYRHILSHFGTYGCWDCKNCKARSECTYPQYEHTYKMLKKEYGANPINQQTLRHLYL